MLSDVSAISKTAKLAKAEVDVAVHIQPAPRSRPFPGLRHNEAEVSASLMSPHSGVQPAGGETFNDAVTATYTSVEEFHQEVSLLKFRAFIYTDTCMTR